MHRYAENVDQSLSRSSNSNTDEQKLVYNEVIPEFDSPIIFLLH